MPPAGKALRGARRPAPAADCAADSDRDLDNLKTALLLSALTLKAPMALYLYSKIVIFQSLLQLPPEASGSYALMVSVAGLLGLVCGFVPLLWPWERKR